MAKKYIDTDEFMHRMYNRAFETDGDTMWQSGCWVRYRAIEAVVQETPAADVVEVVRCKDCTMYKRDKELAEANYCDPNFYCGLLRTEMDEDGYCSYGRRKDE